MRNLWSAYLAEMSRRLNTTDEPIDICSLEAARAVVVDYVDSHVMNNAMRDALHDFCEKVERIGDIICEPPPNVYPINDEVVL